MKKILLFSLFLGASMIGKAQNYWKGTVSSSWDVAGNWSAGAIPDSTSFIRIDAFNTTNPLILTRNVHVHRCDLQDNGALTLGNFEFKSDSSLFNSSGVSSSGGKINSEFVQLGNNQFSGPLTLDVMRGRLYGNTFYHQLTLAATVPPAEALYVSIYRPDTFKGETTFINRGSQNGITVGIQGDNTINFDTTVFEQKFTFRNDFTTGAATSSFGNGENIFPAKIIFKGEVVLDGTHSGSPQPVLSFINAEFRQPVTVKMSGGTVRFGVTNLIPRSVVFKDDLVLDSPGTKIEFGDSDTKATMSVAANISIPSGQMTSGQLHFYKFKSLTTTSQLIQLGGSGLDTIATSHILTTDSADFVGPVYLRADRVQLNGGRFAGLATVEQSGAASIGTATSTGINTVNNGGNRFLDSLIVINRRSGSWQWETHRPDIHTKGMRLIHAALGRGWISIANMDSTLFVLPHVAVSSTVNASTLGGIYIGYGADSVLSPSDKLFQTDDLTRGWLKLYRFSRKGIGLPYSLTAGAEAGLYLEESVFEPSLTLTVATFQLFASRFLAASTFRKTALTPDSWVDGSLFYDLAVFDNRANSGSILFGPRDSEVISFQTIGTDSLRHTENIDPVEDIDWHPNRIFLQAGFSVLPNARYSAVIEPGSVVAKTLGNTIVPPSPEAAALGRYGELPVSLSTGTASFEVPLYEISSGPLKVPVKLTYHSSGIKVNDIATSVGTGWALQAGGAITRIIKGLRDECEQGILNLPIPENTEANKDNFYCFIGNLTTNNTDNLADNMPDDFFYNFNGYSGKFLYHSRDSTDANITPVPLTYPHSNLKIDWVDQLTFTVTDADGTVYQFEDLETTLLSQSARLNPCGANYTSAWYLSRILSPNRTDSITFTYTSVAQVQEHPLWRTTLKEQINEFSLHTYTYSYDFQKTNVNTVLLSEINYKNGKVAFTYANDRQDQSDADAKRLTTVTVYKKDASNAFHELKHFTLGHSYFQCADGNTQVDHPLSPASHAGSPLLKRLRLDSVTEYAPGGNSLPPYSFEYYEDEDHRLPIYGSLAQDYWGYSNGASGNNHLLLWDTDPTKTLAPSATYGADCTPNVAYAVSGALKKITYPTRGYSELEYEANKMTTGEEGGSIRIKKVTHYDGNNAPTQVAYNYTQPYYTNAVFDGSLSSQLYVYTTTIWVRPAGADCYTAYNDITVYPDKASFSLGSEASFIAYKEVEEYRQDGLGNRLGKKRYSYTESVDQAFADFLQELVSNKWRRGLLLKEETFSILPSTAEVLIREQKTSYTELTPLYKTRGVLARLNFNDDSRIPTEICPLGIPRYCGVYSKDNRYDLAEKNEQSSLLLPHRTVTMTFDQNGANPVADTVTYDYSPVHLQLTKQVTRRSEGTALETTYHYPHDFTGNAVYAEMVNRHIWSPVIETQLKENTAVIQKVTTNYKQWYSGTSYDGVAGFFAPFSVQSQQYGGPVLTLLKMGETLGTPTQDGYDASARPVVYTERSGITTELQWYTASGKKDWLKTKTAHGQSVNYDYEEGIGVKKITAPNGLNTHYVYDEFQRLRLIKDHDEKITDRFLYQYAAGPTDKNRTTQQKLRVATATETDADAYTNALITHQYLDGLGRPLQRVGKQQNPAANDLVTEAVEYDKYGRVIKQTAITSASQSSGNYVTDPAGSAAGFYGDTAPFEETEYEKSTLNRPLKTTGVGQAWRTAGKKTTVVYGTAGSDVRRYYLNGSDNLVLSGSFPDSSLYKKWVVSEQGDTAIEITDRQGRLVQRQQQEAGTNYLTTYYVYDGLERLRAVLQPEGYALNATITYNSTQWNQWVFFYRYDDKGRLIEKKVPGAGVESFVYDPWDRLVWKQNALQQQDNKWSFQKYDVLNRLILSGEKSRSISPGALQTEADGATARYENRNSTSPVYYSLTGAYPSVDEADLRSIAYFDDYTNWPVPVTGFDAGNAFHSQYLTVTGLPTGTRLRNSTDNSWLTSINYFDSKGRIIQNFNLNLYGQTERTDWQYNFAGEVLKSRRVRKTQSGVSVTQLLEHDYDHAGRKTALYQTIPGRGREKLAAYSYDGIGRMSQKKIMPDSMYTVGGTPPSIVRPPNPGSNTQDTATQSIRLLPGTIITADSILTYLAQIVPHTGGISISGLQTVDYLYHVRGWLRGINLDGSGNATPTTSQGDLFSYKLDYETTGFYDGNIGKQSWQNTRNNTAVGLRSYTYTYDGASRLKSAAYTGISGENFSLPAITYDKNGNITALQRKGKNGGSFGDIDDLTYYYSGNRLTGVTDAVSGNENVGDFRDSTGSSDYTYWNDGSLKSDGNKGISQIDYDSYLQRVKQISFNNGNWLKFFYDGEGTLLKRELSNGEVWEYTDGIIYKNSLPYQMNSPEGRAVYGNDIWVNEFEYRDHQNNLRVSFKGVNGQLTQSQTSETDPFGLEIRSLSDADANGQNYRFQNQEKIADFGLNLNWFKFRPEDSQIGRFWQVDPLAAEYPHNSTYAFSENKVINHIELEGLEGVLATYSPNDALASDRREIYTNEAKRNEGLKIWRDIAISEATGYAVGAVVGRAIAYFSKVINSSKIEKISEVAVNLEERANTIQNVQKSVISRNKSTTAVAELETVEGTKEIVVSSSRNRLTPAQRAALNEAEKEVTGAGHAEATIVKYAAENNRQVNRIAASRPVCESCQEVIKPTGAKIESMLKQTVKKLKE